MERVASRDLRNHTAAVLRRVAAGEVVAVTVHGEVVAEIVPPRDRRPSYFSRSELVHILANRSADPGLRDQLRDLGGDTDELGPLA